MVNTDMDGWLFLGAVVIFVLLMIWLGSKGDGLA